MDIRSFLDPNRKKQQRNLCSKKLKFIAFMCLFILAGLGFKETYAIYSTLAKTPVAHASTVAEILEVNGEFDAHSWLGSGASGIEIRNISNAKVWVYFNIEGELIQAIQHIDAICLEPGESFEIPIISVNTPPLKANGKVNELGLLGWKNNNQEFSGRIIAGVLNGYARYEVGTITIKGHDVYESFVREQENGKASIRLMREEDGKQELTSANSLSEIESINDILLLIANKITLLKEREELRAQLDRLILENEELAKENTRLRRRVDSLEADVSSLQDSLQGAKKQIDELQKPPAEDPPVENPPVEDPNQPAPGSGGNTGDENGPAPGDVKPAPDESSPSNPADGASGSPKEDNDPNSGSTPTKDPATPPSSNDNSGSESGGQTVTQPSTGQEGE